MLDARAISGLVRPFTLLAPAVGAGCGAITASAATGVAIRALPLALALLSALAATGASNAWNQAFDAALDLVNKPARPIPSGRATVRQALLLGHALAALSLVAAAFVSWGFLACVVVGVLGTWIYSAPPLRTKRHPLGAHLTIAIPRGLLVPVAGWAIVADPLVAEPWALGLVVGLFVLGAAGTKDFADVEGDRAHGCRTLPVILGPVRAARVIAPFLALPFLLYPALGALGLLSAPLVRLAVLSFLLTSLGAFTAAALLRDPGRLATMGENHPAWRGMYLLLLGAHAGVAVVYAI